MEKISVIMPVINEAATLQKTLSRLHRGPNEELIVVDGGSDDGTDRIARQYASRIMTSPRGRAVQMNAGANEASGGILLFLHADCFLPEGAFEIARKTLRTKDVAAGAFDLAIDHPRTAFRLIEWGANLRSHITGIPYGDQGLFLPSSLFRSIGGFANIPLMEDIEIARRLKREGRIVFVKPRITTSPRRWLTEGLVHTTLRDWRIALGYSVFGMEPAKLAKHYRDVR